MWVPGGCLLGIDLIVRNVWCGTDHLLGLGLPATIQLLSERNEGTIARHHITTPFSYLFIFYFCWWPPVDCRKSALQSGLVMMNRLGRIAEKWHFWAVRSHYLRLKYCFKLGPHSSHFSTASMRANNVLDNICGNVGKIVLPTYGR